MPVDHQSTNHVAYYNGYKYNSIQRLHKIGNMHGVKRVMVFCLMMAIAPAVLIITPLYLRHSIFVDVSYPVGESDVIAVMDGISSIFCSAHSIYTVHNHTFNAFQLHSSPEMSNKRKHLRLKKSMTLPDDTLEYWGFYLLKGATVYLKVCSRYEGSRLLVVRGERHLKTCNLMNHNIKNIEAAAFDKDHGQVKVFFEHDEELAPVSHENAVNNTEPKTKPKSEDDKNDAKTDVNTFVQSRLSKAKNKTKKVNVLSQKKPLIESKDEVNLENAYIEEEMQHPHRHSKRKLERLIEELTNDDEDVTIRNPKNERRKRDINQILDGGIEHGGNAINFTDNESSENSVSSFESELLLCYDRSILLAQGFHPSHLCENVSFLEQGEHMETVHEVASDGYYYYIFYSDNDIQSNEIHAVFDIHKPTFQYANNSKNRECINTTQCQFPIGLFSDEMVIVEIPTNDGIEAEENDIDLLISTCHPRMGVYMIFPIAIMFLILSCAFL